MLIQMDKMQLNLELGRAWVALVFLCSTCTWTQAEHICFLQKMAPGVALHDEAKRKEIVFMRKAFYQLRGQVKFFHRLEISVFLNSCQDACNLRLSTAIFRNCVQTHSILISHIHPLPNHKLVWPPIKKWFTLRPHIPTALTHLIKDKRGERGMPNLTLKAKH